MQTNNRVAQFVAAYNLALFNKDLTVRYLFERELNLLTRNTFGLQSTTETVFAIVQHELNYNR